MGPILPHFLYSLYYYTGFQSSISNIMEKYELKKTRHIQHSVQTITLFVSINVSPSSFNLPIAADSALISIGNKRKVGLVSLINKKKIITTIVEK